MPGLYLSEANLDEYFALIEKGELTEEERWRKEMIAISGIMIRLAKKKMPTARADKKLTDLIIREQESL